MHGILRHATNVVSQGVSLSLFTLANETNLKKALLPVASNTKSPWNSRVRKW